MVLTLQIRRTSACNSAAITGVAVFADARVKGASMNLAQITTEAIFCERVSSNSEPHSLACLLNLTAKVQQSNPCENLVTDRSQRVDPLF